jgi:hypothetical protein
MILYDFICKIIPKIAQGMGKNSQLMISYKILGITIDIIPV